ncbi:MAG: Mth938-like domain-containing protein [Candidatus Protistobacter heckmanni]|nr:Mth938-like domain-containing protein [Candidatus Protistobacter heckmanni]
MKLHADPQSALNTINAYGDDYLEINQQCYTQPLIVMPEGPVIPWAPQGFAGLAEADFAPIAELAPELVIFGSGARLRFPHPRLTAALTRRGIGVDTMDMKAACRTYNILMTEGRKVLAALLLETAA